MSAYKLREQSICSDSLINEVLEEGRGEKKVVIVPLEEKIVELVARSNIQK